MCSTLMLDFNGLRDGRLIAPVPPVMVSGALPKCVIERLWVGYYEHLGRYYSELERSASTGDTSTFEREVELASSFKMQGDIGSCHRDGCVECSGLGIVKQQGEKFPEHNKLGGDTRVVHDEFSAIESSGNKGKNPIVDDKSVNANGCDMHLTSSLEHGKEERKFNRGANYERNFKNREAQKMRKQKRKNMGFDWRSRGDNKEPTVEGGLKGFFSDCNSDVKTALRDSRARLYIAENNRKAAEEEAKLKRMDSPEAIVKDLLRVSRAAGQLMKHTRDQKIEGWAKTVTESLVKSVADSAPSSVPSLESVGYGKSALRSSTGSSDEVKSLRLIEYELMVADCQRQFDDMDVVADDHYNKVFADLKRQYSDVSMTKDELKEQQLVESLSAAMQNKGLGFDSIERIFEDAGLPFCSQY